VSKRTARILLIVFSVCWIGWTFMMLMGGILGDCFDDTYSKCWAAKEWGPAVDFWRGLAIQLLAITAYLLFTRKRAQ